MPAYIPARTPAKIAARSLGLLLIVLGVSTELWAQADAQLPTPGAASGLESAQAKASYGIGRQIGLQLMSGGLEPDMLDLPGLVAGIEDAVGRKEPKITQAEFEAAMTEFQQTAQKRLAEKMQVVADKNKVDGPKFLAKYKAMEGVKATPSGLLYKVVKGGTGAKPKATDVVQTHYRGRLVDGTEFDSSYKRNEPATFPVNGVIPGWTEALQMMTVGEKWQLVIPAELAYGERGSPPVIGPHAVLIFDIELLDIQDGAATEAAPGDAGAGDKP